jgi:hypothetical protein
LLWMKVADIVVELSTGSLRNCLPGDSLMRRVGGTYLTSPVWLRLLEWKGMQNGEG